MIIINHCAAVPLQCPFPPETNHAWLADGFSDRLHNEYISKFNSKSAVWNVTVICAWLIIAHIKLDTTRMFKTSSFNTLCKGCLVCRNEVCFIFSYSWCKRSWNFLKMFWRHTALTISAGCGHTSLDFIGYGHISWLVDVGNIMKWRSLWFKSSNKHFTSDKVNLFKWKRC